MPISIPESERKGLSSDIVVPHGASIPTYGSAMAVAEVDGIIYFIGGYNRDVQYSQLNEAYDPVTDTWTTKAPMPTGREFCKAGVINSKIYVYGGYNGAYLGTLEEYDPATNSWTSKTGATARYQFALCVLNGVLHAFAGHDGSAAITTHEIYDPVTDTWTSKAPYPQAFYDLSGAATDTKVYGFGGIAANGYGSALCYEYDPSSDTWAQKADMLKQAYGAEAVELNGLIYVLGGHYGSGTAYDDVQIYDPATDTWEYGVEMPTAKFDFHAVVSGQKIYCLQKGIPYSLEIFDPEKVNTVELIRSDSNVIVSITKTPIPLEIYDIDGLVGTYDVGTYGPFVGPVTVKVPKERAWSRASTKAAVVLY